MKIAAEAEEVGVCACALAILKGYTVEGALDYINTLEKPNIRFNDSDSKIDMAFLRIREKKTYKSIGNLFNLSADNVFRKLERLKKRRKSDDMKKLREKGLYFREIADFYGLSPQAIHQRLN
jgi:hypothetical protein